MTVQSSESAFDPVQQLLRSTVDRLRESCGVVRHRDWWVAFEPRFHHATFVVASAFAGILVSEMHFHSRDMRTETSQRVLDRGNY